MNIVSQFVNNFFYYIVTTAGLIFLGRLKRLTSTQTHLLIPLFRAAFP